MQICTRKYLISPHSNFPLLPCLAACMPHICLPTYLSSHVVLSFSNTLFPTYSLSQRRSLENMQDANFLAMPTLANTSSLFSYFHLCPTISVWYFHLCPSHPLPMHIAASLCLENMRNNSAVAKHVHFWHPSSPALLLSLPPLSEFARIILKLVKPCAFSLSVLQQEIQLHLQLRLHLG